LSISDHFQQMTNATFNYWESVASQLTRFSFYLSFSSFSITILFLIFSQVEIKAAPYYCVSNYLHVGQNLRTSPFGLKMPQISTFLYTGIICYTLF
jgi:hypothetical protein